MACYLYMPTKEVISNCSMKLTATISSYNHLHHRLPTLKRHRMGEYPEREPHRIFFRRSLVPLLGGSRLRMILTSYNLSSTASPNLSQRPTKGSNRPAARLLAKDLHTSCE